MSDLLSLWFKFHCIFLQIERFNSTLCLNNNPLCVCTLFLNPLICWWASRIVPNLDIWIVLLHKHGHTCTTILWWLRFGTIPRTSIARSSEISIHSSFDESPYWFQLRLYLFTFPPTMSKDFSLPTILLLFVFMIAILTEGLTILLICISLMAKDNFFCKLIGNLYFFGEESIQFICLLFWLYHLFGGITFFFM